MRILLLLIFAATAYAGQSIDLATNTGSASSPQRTLNQNFRQEFQVHDWILPGSNKQMYYDGGDGIQVILTTTGVQVTNTVGEAPSASCNVSLAGRTNVLVRVQRNVTTSSFDCEYWNYDGSGYEIDQIPITTPANVTLSGIDFGASGQSLFRRKPKKATDEKISDNKRIYNRLYSYRYIIIPLFSLTQTSSRFSK